MGLSTPFTALIPSPIPATNPAHPPAVDALTDRHRLAEAQELGFDGAKNALTEAGKIRTKVRGLAFGYGLSENIADAYSFLMQVFEPEDRIYIFGF